MSTQAFSRTARIDIFISTGFAFSSSVSTVFVSMYLYRWLDSLASLTVFNLGQFILMPVGFILAALVARRWGNRMSLGIGLALFVAFYGLLVLMGESSARHLIELGVLSGLANGFYWFPYNLITSQAAEGSDKGRFYGISGALASAANALGPLVSTLAITLAPRPELGYSWLFLSIVAVMATMAVATFALPQDSSREPLRVARYLRLRGADGRWRFALGASFAWGLRDGANWSIVSILILQGAGSESAAGYLAIGFSLLGIVASYLAGRAFTPPRYSAFWGWGAALAMVAALAISLMPNMVGAVALGAVGKISDTLILIPFNAAFLGVLARYQRDEGSAAGRNIAAEISINAGRTIGTTLFLVLSFFTADYARLLLPIVTLAVPWSWLIYRRHAADIARGIA
jgi:hypothetical protein